MGSAIALFGAAQKGKLYTLYYCHSVPELFEFLGEPPPDSEGIYHAVQSLLFGFPLLYIRVSEEGISEHEYLAGLELLEKLPQQAPHPGAVFLPRVGLNGVIKKALDFCVIYHSLFIIKEADFYDYITAA